MSVSDGQLAGSVICDSISESRRKEHAYVIACANVINEMYNLNFL